MPQQNPYYRPPQPQQQHPQQVQQQPRPQISPSWHTPQGINNMVPSSSAPQLPGTFQQANILASVIRTYPTIADNSFKITLPGLGRPQQPQQGHSGSPDIVQLDSDGAPIMGAQGRPPPPTGPTPNQQPRFDKDGAPILSNFPAQNQPPRSQPQQMIPQQQTTIGGVTITGPSSNQNSSSGPGNSQASNDNNTAKVKSSHWKMLFISKFWIFFCRTSRRELKTQCQI